MIQDVRTFFASLNTANGFQSHFHQIFDPGKLNRIYILKGGPGTGKSSLMKSVAKIAAEHGYTVDQFICSSDPASLDGIIIEEIGIAILDGTSPHTSDPKYPGVVENIINLGSFWDGQKLSLYKSEILELIKKKNRYYKRAYQFLSAYGEILHEIFSFAGANILKEKMQQNIKRQSAYFFTKEKDPIQKQRNIATFCKYGYAKTNSFEDLSEKIWIIEDHCFSALLYLNEMKEYALSCGQAVWISSSPELPEFPNALYFPNSSACFVVGQRNYESEKPGKSYRYINMKRFLDNDHLSESKQKIRFGQKCMKMLLGGAKDAFEEAGKFHEELERFYISSMDFEKIEKVKNDIITAIFD